MPEDQKLDAITRKIIGAVINVHRALQQLGMKIERQRPLPVRYRGITLDCGYRLDLVVEDLKRGLKRIVNDFPDAARSASAGGSASPA